MPSQEPYNLAIVGFGNVGKALLRHLIARSDELLRRYDITWSLTGLGTRRMGWLGNPDGLDAEALLSGRPVSSREPRPLDVRLWLEASQADVPRARNGYTTMSANLIGERSEARSTRKVSIAELAHNSDRR